MNNKKSLLQTIKDSSVLYTLIAIITGFIVGAILLAVIGISPIAAYGRLIEGIFGKPKYLAWSIVYASPLILTGLSVAFSFKTGVFNIGAEGQFVVGSLAAVVVGSCLNLPPVIHVIACAAAAMLAGALWGTVVAILKVKKGINEVLSYIMFNWIAYYLSNYMVNTEWLHNEGNAEATKDIKATASIVCPDFITKLTDCKNTNWGIVIAVVAAIVIWFIISKTTLGFQLRAVGFNKNAAEYGGINSNAAVMKAMAISGAMAGLGGMVQLCGMGSRISQFAGQEGFGFEGITVALIASSNPIGCIFSGLFYGMMKYGGTKLTLIKAPSEVIDIIMGVIVLFIAISHVFRHLLNKKKGGK
ncbi:MAG: ABC transporter permease [Lachnospiraceae bacterium]|nr:ABC transporter permease [Lachnospiraceae bacterium]